MAQRQVSALRKGGLLAIGAGAAAGLALTVAPSYACTALAQIRLFPAAGDPGAPFTVRGDAFTPEGEVSLKWGGANARILRTTTTDAAGNLVESLRVPADAQATSYLVTAIHTDKEGKTRTSSFAFKVTPAAAVVVDPDVPADDVDEGPATGDTSTAPTEPVVAPTSGGSPAARAKPVAPSRKATTAEKATTPPAPTVARRAAAPGEAPASPTPTADADLQPSPIAEVGAVASDLWSGLSAERKPSLLEAPAAGQRDRSPLAILLLGSGLAAMAGTAMVAGRRRLVRAVSIVRR